MSVVLQAGNSVDIPVEDPVSLAKTLEEGSLGAEEIVAEPQEQYGYGVTWSKVIHVWIP